MNKKNILLSICIPTYNRPIYTLETLESVASQMTDETELVVCDDYSNDGTYKVISLFRKAHPKIKISIEENNPNLGFDRNVLKVMGKAKGKYAWLFGNDDILLPGAINKILHIIKSGNGPSLIHVNYSRYDDLLKKVNAKRMVGSIGKDMVFDNAEEFFFKKNSI